jgi:hypothetical protein
MVSKCANPACPEIFRYLHQGKLFRFEWNLAQDSSSGIRDSLRHLEFFWLCESCATTMTVVYKKGSGVKAVPKVSAWPAAS